VAPNYDCSGRSGLIVMDEATAALDPLSQAS
jgi:hypothetical protein